QAATSTASGVIAATHPDLGERFFYSDGANELLFTENETNAQRLFGVPNRTPYVKDGINDYVVHSHQNAVNAERTGTKASAHYSLTVGAGESRILRLRLSDVAPTEWATRDRPGGPFVAFDSLMEARRREADEFYASVIPAS